MTKFKGQAASYAPSTLQLGRGLLRATTSALVLGSVSVLAPHMFGGGAGAAFAGSCVESGGVGSGVFTCSGAAGVDVTQNPAPGAGGVLSVTTLPGFGIDVAIGNAFNLINAGGDTDIVFADANMSAITGDATGIYAAGSGTGAVIITTTGPVTGTMNSGIYARTLSGTNLAVTATDTTGGDYGIFARGFGTGTINVTSTGTATGTNTNGIYADGGLNSTGVTISSFNAYGGYNGIGANNQGTGAITVTSSGQATGTTSLGIGLANQANGTDVTVNAADTMGGLGGIGVANYGTGMTSITSTGQATGTVYAGIGIVNFAEATDLIIQANEASGGQYGIVGLNNGMGELRITATGPVTGTTREGIDAVNSGTDLTISVVDVTGGNNGIFAQNDGTGALSITSTGTVLGDGFNGINAVNSNAGTDLTVTVVDVTGDDVGINARNEGSGALNVTSTGTVTSRDLAGVAAVNYGTDLTISVVDIDADNAGIGAYNMGSGALSVMSTGSITSATRGGMYLNNMNPATDLIISVVNVTAENYGISAQNAGTGTTTITVNGIVSGATGTGIQTSGYGDTQTSITLNNGADVSGGNGDAITNDNGNSDVTLNTGSSITGNVVLGDGSDDLILAGGDVSAAMTLDGGDDSSTADGFIDTIRATGTTNGLMGANLLNWEVFEVDGGSVAFSDTTLTIGDGNADTGVRVTNGGTFAAGQTFTLNSHLTTSSGGMFSALGGGTGAVTINGNVTNNGILSTQDGSAGDVLTIDGNLSGTGTVMLDVMLDDDASQTDLLAITGDNTATTTLDVANAGGSGDVTALGIEVVTVGGASTGMFVLDGDFVTPEGEQAVVAGAFAYTLEQDQDGDWALLSQATTEPPITEPPITEPPITEPPIIEPPIIMPPIQPPGNARFQPNAPIYEVYPQNAVLFAGAPSYQQRTAGRSNIGGANGQPVFSFAAQDVPSPFWMRIEAADISFDPSVSTTATTTDTNVRKLEAGADFVLTDTGVSRFLAGVSVHYGIANSDVTSVFGTGSIDTDGYGVGLSATWLLASGFYVDGQFQYSWLESDLTSNIFGPLVSGNDGSVRTVSVELGKKMETSVPNLTITPQAQLSHSVVDLDGFVGPFGATVIPDDIESTKLRLGLAAERNLTDGIGRETRLHGIVNIEHEFDGTSLVNVSGVPLISEPERWSAEIGLGGSRNIDHNVALFGEVSYRSQLDDLGSNTRFGVSLGLRMEF